MSRTIDPDFPIVNGVAEMWGTKKEEVGSGTYRKLLGERCLLVICRKRLRKRI